MSVPGSGPGAGTVRPGQAAGPPTGTPGLPTQEPWRADATLGIGVAVAWLLAVLTAVSWDYWHPAWIESYWWVAPWLGVPLALRRAAPRVGFWLTVVAYPLAYGLVVHGSGLQSDFHVVPLLIAAFVATRATAVAPAVAFAAVVAGTVWLAAAVPPGFGLLPRQGLVAGGGVSHLLLLGSLLAATVVLGGVFARLDRTAASLAQRNAELEALQEVRARAAVRSERARIARELHDVVAHHVSAIVVRAQAADRVGGDQPDACRDAVRWIAPAGREALDAMRSVVRVLGDDDPGPLPWADGAASPLVPAPTLADLAAVLDRVRGAGLVIDAELPDPWPVCPPEVGLAVVRVAQEALTNVLVHSTARRADVKLSNVRGRLVLEVTDHGSARTPGPPGRRGNGLVHMRERAAMLGATLTAGATSGGGWTVRMEVPDGAGRG